MTRILITRPIESAAIWADDLRALGYDVLVSPLLHYSELKADYSDVGQFDILVFTSVHAVRVFSNNCQIRDLPLLTVGTRTASEAKSHGFTEPLYSAENSDELASFANIHYPRAKILHLCGKDGFEKFTNRKVIYGADFAENFSTEAINAFENNAIDIVTLLSPRTAENYINLLNINNLIDKAKQIKTLCISHNTAKILIDNNFNNIVISPKADISSLLTVLKNN